MATPDGERRSYTGAPTLTTIATPVNDTATNIIVQDASNLPAAAASKFAAVVINRGGENEEVIWYSPKSGNTLQNCLRGAHGSQAFAHQIGESVEHAYTALDANEANQHVTDDTLDQHGQYLHIANDRTVSASHTFTDVQTLKGDDVGLRFVDDDDDDVATITVEDNDLAIRAPGADNPIHFYMGATERVTIGGDNIIRMGGELRVGVDTYTETFAFMRIVTEGASSMSIVSYGPNGTSDIKYRVKGNSGHYFSDATNNYWGAFDYIGNTASDSTALQIRWGGTLKRVEVGAPNSGGTGFRMLRLTN